MTITYPQSTQAKKQRSEPPPIAPTPVLRADAAMADAHRLFGSAMGQAFGAALWLVLLSLRKTKENDPFGIAIDAIMIVIIASLFIWASQQGSVLGKPRYTSGLASKTTGVAKIFLVACVSVIGLAAFVPVGMFVAWKYSVDFPQALTLLQAGLVMSLLFLSASMFLRAIAALNFARRELATADHAAAP